MSSEDTETQSPNQKRAREDDDDPGLGGKRLINACSHCLGLDHRWIRCVGGHPLCKKCIKCIILSVVEDGLAKLSCPIPECPEEIKQEELDILGESVSVCFAQYHLAARQTPRLPATSRAPWTGRYDCPHCGCHVTVTDAAKLLTCPSCQAMTCKYCKADWTRSYDANNVLIGPVSETQDMDHTTCGLFHMLGPDLRDGDLPPHWEVVDLSRYEKEGSLLFPVSLNSQEGRLVVEAYGFSSDSQVLAVQRVQNQVLWSQYSFTKKLMQKELKPHLLLEKFLFHGTSKDGIQVILKEGFDFRKEIKNGTRYGKGTYFSLYADYSEYYSKVSKQVFVVQVLCGRFGLGTPTTTHPPCSPEGRMFDSCVDNVDRPTMFVTFDNHQSYPAYLVTIEPIAG